MSPKGGACRYITTSFPFSVSNPPEKQRLRGGTTPPGTQQSPAETDLYYLNSRYYDPEIGRFINADIQFDDGAGLLAYNLYAYCANNPVICLDIDGFFLFTAIGAAIGAIGGAVSAAIEGKSAKEIKAAAVSGAISGGISGLAMDILTVTGGSATVVMGVCAAAGIIGSVAGSVVESNMTGKKLKKSEVIVDALFSAATGAIGGAMEDSMIPMMKNIAASAGKNY